MELGSHNWMVCLAAELLTEECIKSPGEITSREVELGSHNWMVCLAGELTAPQQLLFGLSLRLCSGRLLKQQFSEGHKLLRTGALSLGLCPSQ